MIEGHFIVIEGIDGAGTTTQAQRLAEHFQGRGLPVCVTQPLAQMRQVALKLLQILHQGSPLA